MLPFVVIASYKALFIGSQIFDISGIDKGIRNAYGDNYYKDNYMFGIQAEAWW